MMKLRKLIPLISLFLTVSASAYAQIELGTQNDVLTISGKSDRANSETVCMLLKKGVAYEDFLKTGKENDVLWFYQSPTDVNGSYSFTYNLTSGIEYGNYIVIVDDGTYKEYAEYEYVAQEDRALNAVVKELRKAENADAVKKILQDNKALLGITKSYTESQWNIIAKKLLADCPKLTLDNVETYINAALKAAEEEKPLGGGGGGGGGGTTVIIGDHTTAVPPTTQKPVTDIKPEQKGFNDVSDTHYAFDAINSLVNKGILSGVGNDKFEPDREVKREEFAHMLCKAFNFASNAEVAFEDVPEDAWYYDSIKACFGAGIVKGADESHFGVGLSLTRQDACVMIYRIIADKAQYSSSQYADRAAVAEYAVEAVDALSAMQVINGMGNNCFEPTTTLTRAQAATIIYKVVENVISI